MKFSIAIACLLGLVSADEAQNRIAFAKNLMPIRDTTTVQVLDSESESGSDSESESESDSASESDEEAPQNHTKIAMQMMAQKVIEKNPIWNAWDSVKDADEGQYERIITPNFSSDTDDLFMRSMLKNYAREKRTSIEELDDGQKIGGESTG